MDPVLGLRLDRRVPPTIEMDDAGGGGQVQARPPGPQRKKHHPARRVALERIERGAARQLVHAAGDYERPEVSQLLGELAHPERLRDEL